MERGRVLGGKNLQTLTTRILDLKGLIYRKWSLEKQPQGISTCVNKAEWIGSQVVSKVKPLAIKTPVAEPLWPVQHPDTQRNPNPVWDGKIDGEPVMCSFLYQNYALFCFIFG